MRLNRSSFSGWRVLVGCSIVMFLVQSSIQTLSVHIPAIAQDTGWAIPDIALISTTATTGAFLANLALAFLVEKLGPKYVLCLGIVMFSLQAYLLSISTSTYMLWFGGFVAGGAIAFGTVAPCSILITNWFVKNRSQYVALVVAASMFGSTLLNPVSGLLIDSFGWRVSYRTQAVVVGLLSLAAVLLLVTDSPAKLDQRAHGEQDGIFHEKDGNVGGLDAKAARRTPAFWLMLAGIFCIGLSTNIENYLPAYWQSEGMSPVTSSAAMGGYAFVAAVGSMLMSKVNDKLGGKYFVLITSSFFALGSVLMIVTDVVHIFSLLMLACAFFAMGSKKASGLTPPLVVAEAFGRRYYGAIIGTFTAVLQLGIAASNLVIGELMELSGGNAYDLPFFAMAGLNFVGMVLVMTALIQKPYRG